MAASLLQRRGQPVTNRQPAHELLALDPPQRGHRHEPAPRNWSGNSRLAAVVSDLCRALFRLHRRQRAGSWPGGTTSTRAATSPQAAHSGSAKIPIVMQPIISSRAITAIADVVWAFLKPKPADARGLARRQIPP
jgi:hypothetical protein